MNLVRYTPALVGIAMLLAGSAEAQTAPAPNAATKITSSRVVATTKTTKTNVPVPRTAKSLDCSKQADAKGLHGGPRKHFMSGCKKA